MSSPHFVPTGRRTRKTERTFVLDSSVALAWFFEDENDAYADAVAVAFKAATAIVPELWHLEMANALLMGERRKRGGKVATVTQFLELVSSLPIAVDEETATHAWHATISLARAYSLSAYDAAYLELAMRRGLPLATNDRQLLTAAKALGVLRFGA